MRAAPPALSLPSSLPARAGTLLPSASILAGSVPRCPAGSTTHQPERLRALLPSLAEAPEAGLSFRLVAARGSWPPRGGSASGTIAEHHRDPSSVGEAERRAGCSQVTKAGKRGFSDGRFLFPLFSCRSSGEIRDSWQLSTESALRSSSLLWSPGTRTWISELLKSWTAPD